MGNSFVHSELMTSDPAKAKAFYKKIFDWKLSEMPAFNYTSIDTGKIGGGGGIGKVHAPNQPTAWMPYVEVASVKATIAKAKKAGATIVTEYMPIGDMGAIGIFVDPTGATLGLWELAAPMKGAAKTKTAAKKTPAKKAAKAKAKPAKAAKVAKKATKKPAKKK